MPCRTDYTARRSARRIERNYHDGDSEGTPRTASRRRGTRGVEQRGGQPSAGIRHDDGDTDGEAFRRDYLSGVRRIVRALRLRQRHALRRHSGTCAGNNSGTTCTDGADDTSGSSSVGGAATGSAAEFQSRSVAGTGRIDWRGRADCRGHVYSQAPGNACGSEQGDVPGEREWRVRQFYPCEHAESVTCPAATPAAPVVSLQSDQGSLKVDANGNVAIDSPQGACTLTQRRGP